MPILPPVDIAAYLAREKAKKEHPELTDDDIGIIFISPCPAKVSYIKNNFAGRAQLHRRRTVGERRVLRAP